MLRQYVNANHPVKVQVSVSNRRWLTRGLKRQTTNSTLTGSKNIIYNINNKLINNAENKHGL